MIYNVHYQHNHPENHSDFKALAVNEGVESAPIVNPYLRPKRKRRDFTVPEYVEGILKGDISILSQAVTLVESSLPEQQIVAQQVIEKCLPYAGKSAHPVKPGGAPGLGDSGPGRRAGLKRNQESPGLRDRPDGLYQAHFLF